MTACLKCAPDRPSSTQGREISVISVPQQGRGSRRRKTWRRQSSQWWMTCPAAQLRRTLVPFLFGLDLTLEGIRGRRLPLKIAPGGCKAQRDHCAKNGRLFKCTSVNTEKSVCPQLLGLLVTREAFNMATNVYAQGNKSMGIPADITVSASTQ